MYFQIENTPERIKKARRAKVVLQASPKEECPRLTLAPFSRPPQVLFENVIVGSSCERYLELFNPSKETQQITLNKTLPGLCVHLPGECIVLEPETCYCVSMVWTPLELVALRETLRFTNEKRGRFDVIVVLKSTLPGKSKIKGFKTSPGKIKKKSLKRSPGNINKKKAEVIHKTTEVTKTVNVVQSTKYKVLVTQSENVTEYRDVPVENPFESDYSSNFTFNTSEVFPNRQRTTDNILKETDSFMHNTYEKPNKNYEVKVPNYVLKASNKQNIDTSASDIFDNITFTPLKSMQNKTEKLDQGPKIVFSINSDSDYDDSLDQKDSNKENETHSIVCITSTHTTSNKWLTVDNHTKFNRFSEIETPIVIEKKIPKTSSPKDMNSPNFSINTDYSRISDLSFFPQRFSTERKTFPKMNTDTHDTDDHNIKLSTDTFTKESPLEHHINQIESRQAFSVKEPRMCKQALFRDQENRNYNERNCYRPEQNIWQNDLRSDMRSPPRSITPPLQSIPEESMQFSDTHTFDRSDRHTETFAINRTYNKHEKTVNRQTMWSKKAVVKSKGSLLPNRDSLINHTYVSNKSTAPNVSLSYIPNIYTQSLIVNPFSSTTQYYDEALIKKFEKDFKHWLNYILTPPDLESNIEQKIDIGKVWIDNRNVDVPTAPTKEKVCSSYHNSHRLESLRKSARTLLKSPEVSEVLRKLNAQIDKKLICIRDDRNLHLDIGLQKTIMEIILSYNPLWLRIGLEVIYNQVLPLKSNSDIEGLTAFVIQRMFKNPFLKNKNSKSTAPNMLLPAYIDAIKKFSLKKFFMLVYFLDQAKQRKLISHDPCLFCRNAVCKESRQVLIRFTRELIAGIGDITKHLRPTGYLVVHKQTYLDEYKYGVNDIAIDLRDGVRLTKVSEIILLKDNLIRQLRAPAISRLQKIHNVEVALKSLREENFDIEGEITATDIADGHREKTLSLLWQLIHVFRAPLFEKAANVIQLWWRKKYEVILEKKKIEEAELRKKHVAADIIQFWWRQILNKRRYKQRLYEVTRAALTLQKYYRMWHCRSQFLQVKRSILKIENWYRNMKLIQEAKEMLCREREERRLKSAVMIQSQIRRWLCMKQYRETVRKTIKIQSVIRGYLLRKQYLALRASTVLIQTRYRSIILTRKVQEQYLTLRKATITIQRRYRAQVLMRKCKNNYEEFRKAVIIIQRRYRAKRRMVIEKDNYELLKQSCVTIQRHIRAYRLGKEMRKAYLEKRRAVEKIQNWYRNQQIRLEYKRLKQAVIIIQNRYRAQKLMQIEQSHFKLFKQSCIAIQRYYRAYRLGKEARIAYLHKKKAVIKIQNWFRSRQIKLQYNDMKQAVTRIQSWYRAQKLMQKEQSNFKLLKQSCVIIQRYLRAYCLGKKTREAYLVQRKAAVIIQNWYRNQQIRLKYKYLKQAVLTIQHRYRALKKMRLQRQQFELQRNACITIQRYYKAYRLGKEKRLTYLQQRNAVLKIQDWYRSSKRRQYIEQEFRRTKQAVITVQRRFRAKKQMVLERSKYDVLRHACITIQRSYRAHRLGTETRTTYLKQRNATIKIQNWYRNCKKTQITKLEYQQRKIACITIQTIYRNYILTKKQREKFIRLKMATVCIQKYYRCYRETKMVRHEYLELKTATVCLQRRFRGLLAMKSARNQYLLEKKSAIIIQNRFRALLLMKKVREEYLTKRTAVTLIQRKLRAHYLMKRQRKMFLITKIACIRIQRYYRAYREGEKQRRRYLAIRKAATVTQIRYRALISMRKERENFLTLKSAALVIQDRYRAYKLMVKQRCVFKTTLEACVLIQRKYRAYIVGKKERDDYMKLKCTVLTLQKWYRSVTETRRTRLKYLELRQKVVRLQSFFRMVVIRKQYLKKQNAILKIQRYFRSYLLMNKQKEQYHKMKLNIIKMQALVRCYLERKKYQRLKAAAITVQCVYRLKKKRELIIQNRRDKAASCIQKNVRRYLAQTKYREYIQKVILIQRLWRGKRLMKHIRTEYLYKIEVITKVQAHMRGYLVRKQVESKRENLKKLREEQRRNWAASKIQALFRGHKARASSSTKATELRKRWREGALESTQKSLAERNEEAMYILKYQVEIEPVLKAFRILEQTTVLWPQVYAVKASVLVHNVFMYMAATNRSISSVEVLTSGATLLVNLTRYHLTGPKLYKRDRIAPILKYMWRFSNSEQNLFCRLATYVWLFSKYKDTEKDLREFLREPENHKILVAIKNNIGRMRKMASNSMKLKLSTPQPSRKISHILNQSERVSCNVSVCSSTSSSNSTRCAIILPSLDPDYGIVRTSRPRYFVDPQQAIDCIFSTYNL